MPMVSIYLINGVQVEIYNIPDMDEEEAAKYIDLVEKKSGAKLVKLQIEPVGADEITLTYLSRGEKFERIRRITGYLVGTLEKWNNAKRAEERDRVKHVQS